MSVLSFSNGFTWKGQISHYMKYITEIHSPRLSYAKKNFSADFSVSVNIESLHISRLSPSPNSYCSSAPLNLLNGDTIVVRDLVVDEQVRLHVKSRIDSYSTTLLLYNIYRVHYMSLCILYVCMCEYTYMCEIFISVYIINRNE